MPPHHLHVVQSEVIALTDKTLRNDDAIIALREDFAEFRTEVRESFTHNRTAHERLFTLLGELKEKQSGFRQEASARFSDIEGRANAWDASMVVAEADGLALRKEEKAARITLVKARAKLYTALGSGPVLLAIVAFIQGKC